MASFSNPNSSDRSTVRNQSTPSEPNPNTRACASNPNTRSASKAKKESAAKRGKDNAFAEEHPQPKKQSASKGKKVIPASNPSRKRLARQQQQQEVESAVRVWSEEEENVAMHCYLNCAVEGVEFSEVIGKIKDLLDHEASRLHVYEKLGSMEMRYRSIKSKITQNNIKEDDFVYQSGHEKELYKLWKEAWGEQHEEVEMEVHHTEAGGDDEAEEEEEVEAGGDEAGEEEEVEEVESDGGTDTGKEAKVPSTDKAPVANDIPVKPRVSSRPILPNNKPEDRLRSETIIKENGDIVAKVIGEVKKMAETSEAELRASLISHLWPSLANGNFRS